MKHSSVSTVWDKIPDGFKWIAENSNGEVHAFKTKPFLAEGSWLKNDFSAVMRVFGLIDKAENCNWEWNNSLYTRPDEVKKEGDSIVTYTKKQVDDYIIYIGTEIPNYSIDDFIKDKEEEDDKKITDAVGFLEGLGYSVAKTK